MYAFCTEVTRGWARRLYISIVRRRKTVRKVYENVTQVR